MSSHGKSTDRPPSAAFSRKPRPQVHVPLESNHETKGFTIREPPRVRVNGVPTYAALARKSTTTTPPQDPSWISMPAVNECQKPISTKDSASIPQKTSQSLTSFPVHRESPWCHFNRLGIIVQREHRLIICTSRSSNSTMYMLKQLSCQASTDLIENLHSLDHPSIMRVQSLFVHEEQAHIATEYARYTLEELIGVHVSLEEPHVRYIAKQVSLMPLYSIFF